MLACKVLYYNTKTKLDLTKLFLLEVSQLHVQIYGKNLKFQKIKLFFSYFSFKNADLLDGMLVYIGKKLLFIAFRDGNVLFIEYDTASVYHLDFAFLHDEGTMHTDELVGRQTFFHGLHAQEGEDGLLSVFQMDFHIVFQTLDVEDVAEWNLY